MSGEALKLEIRKGAEEKAKQAVADAQAKAEKILADAEFEAKRILDSRTLDAQRRLEQVERSEAAKARMECTRKILALQSLYMERAFEEAEARLKSLPTSDSARYSKMMAAFFAEGSRELGASDLVAVVREGDRKLAEGIARASGVSISPERLDSSGGVVLRTKDERAYFVSTFESRLLKAREDLRAKVTNTLLGRE